MTALARLRQEHFTPDRDLILALTADEEEREAVLDAAARRYRRTSYSFF